MVKSNTSYRSTFRLTLLFMTMCIIMGIPQNLASDEINYPEIASEDGNAAKKMSKSSFMKSNVLSADIEVTTASDWQLYNTLLLPQPDTVQGTSRRMHEIYECIEWHVSKETVTSF